VQITKSRVIFVIRRREGRISAAGGCPAVGSVFYLVVTFVDALCLRVKTDCAVYTSCRWLF